MKIDQLTFTRFLAAFSIIVYHFGKDIFPFSNPAVSFIFQQSNTGVSYFFILSGFVMIIAYGNKSYVNIFGYLKNRFARIYPVYFLALIFTIAYYFQMGYTIDVSSLWLNIFTLQAWVPGKALSLNSPAWSLSVEFFFYVSFPFLMNHVYKRFSHTQLILPVIICWLLSQLALHWFVTSSYYNGFPSKSHDLIYYFPVMHLNEFLTGNMAGLFFSRKLKDKKGNYAPAILFVLAAIIIMFRFPMGFIFHDGLLAFLFIPLILLISMHEGRLTGFFSNKLFVFLGEISYGIYILLSPIHNWVDFFLAKFHLENPVIKFYLFLSVLLLTASFSYIFIETPLRIKIKNLDWPKKLFS